ncbi:MAG: HypC/HybG/HupF family hydrogenase formation chaperone [Desulfurococcaceae archaeon]
MCLGVPGEVIYIDKNGVLPMAKVRIGGMIKEVILAIEDEIKVGDHVIVHAGIAIGKIDPEEGKKILELYEEILTS